MISSDFRKFFKEVDVPSVIARISQLDQFVKRSEVILQLFLKSISPADRFEIEQFTNHLFEKKITATANEKTLSTLKTIALYMRREENFSQIERAIDAIQDPREQSLTLRHFVSTLILYDKIDDACRVAKKIGRTLDQAEAFEEISDFFLSKRQWEDAIEFAMTIQDSNERFRVLWLATPVLIENHQLDLAIKVVEWMKRESANNIYLSDLIEMLAHSLAIKGRFSEAMKYVQQIEVPCSLPDICEALFKYGYAREIFDFLETIDNHGIKCRSLSKIAIFLGKTKKYDLAFDVVSKITETKNRLDTLIIMIVRMAEQEAYEQIQSLLEKIKDEKEKTNILKSLISNLISLALIEESRSQQNDFYLVDHVQLVKKIKKLEIAFKIAQMHTTEEAKSISLVSIAEAYAQLNLIKNSEIIMRQIVHPCDKSKVFETIAIVYLRNKQFDKARNAAENILNSTQKATILNVMREVEFQEKLDSSEEEDSGIFVYETSSARATM